MRRITDEEVLLVSGGGLFDEAMSAISSFFGGFSSAPCVPGTYNMGNGVTAVQTCGGSQATVVISGPGWVNSLTTTAGPSGGFTFYNLGANANTGTTTTVVTTIGGKTTVQQTK